jgi:hypothetical protein
MLDRLTYLLCLKVTALEQWKLMAVDGFLGLWGNNICLLMVKGFTIMRSPYPVHRYNGH